MIKRSIVVFWCVFVCVTSHETGSHLAKPTPVLNIAADVQSTDAQHPLKVNKEPVAVQITTGIPSGNGLVNFAVLTEISSTGVGNPMINNHDIVNQQTTKPSDIKPTSVINVPVITETDAIHPYPLNINNMREITMSTGTVEGGFVKPTSVVKAPTALETYPAVPLTNDDEPETPPSTGIFNMIEPSTVWRDNEAKPTVATPNMIKEQPNKVLSTELANSVITENEPLCTCVYSEDVSPTPAMDTTPPENALPPQFYAPIASKPHASISPINFYQSFISLQLNFFINNIPVLSANVDPYYI